MSKTSPKHSDLTHEELKQVLHYDPETGDMTWLKRISIRIMPGRKAGCENVAGYIVTSIFGTEYLAHRLIWFYVHGKWPTNDIDHVNGNRADNRLSNLREATRSQNFQNKRRGPSISGIKGVRWHAENRKWCAGITISGKTRYLGSFLTKEDAGDAYRKAALEYFGEFARFD
jgi:hypothetical protein